MDIDLDLLVLTAISIGFVHTLIGPDHEAAASRIVSATALSKILSLGACQSVIAAPFSVATSSAILK